MSALIEPADPDFRVHAAWLARVSEAADGARANQVPQQHLPQQDAGIAGGATSSFNTADRLGGPDTAPRSRLGRRLGVIIIAWGSFAFVVALAAVSVMPQHLRFSESSRQSRDRTIEMGSSEWLPSPTAATPNEPGSPKLIAQSSPGIFGEPAPLGLTLQGGASDAVVIIKGLVPGMELSTGNLVAADTWQLQATDLPYAWIAPPDGFVGSADLVAELRLPNSQILDRQSIRLEWTQPAANSKRDREREQMTQQKQEQEVMPPIAPAATPHSNDRGLIAATPQDSAKVPQLHGGQEESNGARARGKNNLRRSVNEGNPSQSVGDSKPAVRGFWDWSR
jgi:hypothetical protein